MIRPAPIWVIFGLGLAILLTALGYITTTALRLEATQVESLQQAAFEEKVRLALWRMDSALAPLLVQEASRPYFTYQAFFPAERAYDRMFSELQPGEILLPSPLLHSRSTNILLHFQYAPDGSLSSPQVPPPGNPLPGKSLALDSTEAGKASQRLAELGRLLVPNILAAAWAPPPTESAPLPVASTAVQPQAQPARQPPPQTFVQSILPQAPDQARQQAQQQKIEFNNAELQARASNYKQAAQMATDFNRTFSPGTIVEGMVKPIWFDRALVLARRVSVDGRDYIQGCWLDWPNIRSWMLATIHDLLPEADLKPVHDETADHEGRYLASLPVLLVPGTPPSSPAAPLSPIQFTLIIAWLGLLLASSAVAVLLHGALSLSERRGAFVSAVTHELRTPLTTFRIYSEMLAGGMVPDKTKQQQYLQTLHSEAHRLSHLVENVLAYARLERGPARRQPEPTTLGDLVARIQPRLAQRAEQAGLELHTDLEAHAAQTQLWVDASAVEQILFNLIDNACKYATPNANGKSLILQASATSPTATFRVRDYGPGIPPAQAKRLFQPFNKSAQEAAQSAPGVGLGLALSRRLSRHMGGDLQLDRSVQDGARFVLTLPIRPAGTRKSSL